MDRCESIEGDNIICKHSKLQFGITSGTLFHTHTISKSIWFDIEEAHSRCMHVRVCVCCFFHSRLFCYSKQYIQMKLSTCCCYMSSAMHRCSAAFQTKYENEIWKKLAQEKRDTHKRLFVGWKLTLVLTRARSHTFDNKIKWQISIMFLASKRKILHTLAVWHRLFRGMGWWYGFGNHCQCHFQSTTNTNNPKFVHLHAKERSQQHIHQALYCHGKAGFS